MKRIICLLALLSLLAFAGSAMAFEKGDEVEVCNSDGEYALLKDGVECGGEIMTGTVVDVMETEIVVEVGEGQTVTFPAE